MTAGAKRPFVVIGTSGSHDYLKDGTGDRRYWRVGDLEAGPTAPISPEDRVRLDALIALGGDAMCDGIHDAEAPPQYLCTRCFPEGREDPSEQEDDGYEESRQDHDQEME